MTWRTPCTDGTLPADYWTSKWPEERREAQLACLQCPILEDCAKDAATAKHRDGVWAATDLTTSKRSKLPQAPIPCGSASCNRMVLQPASGRRRSFCNATCREREARERAA